MENNFNNENEKVSQQPITETEPIEINKVMPSEAFEPMKSTVQNELLGWRMSDNEYMEKSLNSDISEKNIF
ncbi:MAG: hypothetical protein JSS63_03615 [Bacteroidetes bacterium]|nr:hypothetical protein [Bacteroidota bacterium]